MNGWWILLLIGIIVVLGLAWVLVNTPWMNGVHDDNGLALTINCPMGIGFNYDESVVPEQDQKVVPAIIKRRRIVFNSNPQRIPRTIYQTHERSEIPVGMSEAIQRLLSLNPDYHYRYLDNQACRKFLRKHFEPRVINAYNKLVPGAYKADLFRYCVLYIRGGVYLDTGVFALTSLNSVIQPTDTFISARDGQGDGIYNAIMACVPKHPIVKLTLDLVLDRIEREEYGCNPLYPTGPLALRDGFKAYFNQTPVWTSQSTQIILNAPPTIEEKDYGQGIRLMYHHANPKCSSNIVSWSGQELFYTKYPTYRSDMKWYSRVPNYTPLYHQRMIYSQNSEWILE